VHGHLKAATQASGDWWWSERLPDNSVFVFLGDVTGHGPASAMVTSIVAGIYQTVRQTMLSQSMYGADPTHFDSVRKIEELLRLIDNNLSNNIGGKYLMCYTAVHWAENGDLTLWGAGAPSVILAAEKDFGTESVSCHGHPFGVGKTTGVSIYKAQKFFGRLLVYSDGFLELKNQVSRPVTELELSKWLSAGQAQGLDEFVAQLKNVVAMSHVRKPLLDDVTFVVAEKNSA